MIVFAGLFKYFSRHILPRVSEALCGCTSFHEYVITMCTLISCVWIQECTDQQSFDLWIDFKNSELTKNPRSLFLKTATGVVVSSHSWKRFKELKNK